MRNDGLGVTHKRAYKQVDYNPRMKQDAAELERQLIEQGEAAYVEPNVSDPVIQVWIANPLYGQGVPIPMPTDESKIEEAMNAVSYNGQFDWELVDVSIYSDAITREILKSIGYGDLFQLNEFAETVSGLEPHQTEWALYYADQTGETFLDALDAVLNASDTEYGEDALDYGTAYFPTIDDAVRWYVQSLPQNRLMAYLDYSLVDPILVSEGYADSETVSNDIAATEEFISDHWNRIVNDYESYFDTDKLEGDFDIGDWFSSIEGKHGYYIFT